MSAPIADGTPPTGDASGPYAGFAPGPPVASLCGFTLPIPRFKFGYKLPSSFGIPIPPPLPKIPLGLDCSKLNPRAIGSKSPPGGGRPSNVVPDPDGWPDNGTVGAGGALNPASGK